MNRMQRGLVVIMCVAGAAFFGLTWMVGPLLDRARVERLRAAQEKENKKYLEQAVTRAKNDAASLRSSLSLGDDSRPPSLYIVLGTSPACFGNSNSGWISRSRGRSSGDL